jgi:ubiquinone/menaquinone biosynthesis C-methylase UbiE
MKEPEIIVGPIGKRLHKVIFSYLKDVPPGKLLDIGCGRGIVSYKLHKKGFKAYGLDVERTCMFKEINWKKVDLNKGVLPYPDDFFDVVLFIEVLEHLENPRTILREVSRVLKKRGLAIISTPHILSLPQRLYFLFTGNFLHFQYPWSPYCHITPFSLHMLKDELVRAKIPIEDIRYDRGFIPLLRITLPPSYLFGDLCMVKAKKVS